MIQYASFNGFFKTILLLIGFYYLVKFLARIFLPILLKKAVNKVQENFEKQQSQGGFAKGQNSDFQTTKKDNPKSTKKVGDYIDYEEIE
ncbi:DUF4834 domain-containing protein [Flavobacterium sp.]|uniref:DUF4834 domain-containing protein n=1 Tax=Flavobacterium sp. TaxID=239 RepID=UPI00286DB17B|nr:DUF4834 domain-containing protein [Flavobacterium sp.]